MMASRDALVQHDVRSRAPRAGGEKSIGGEAAGLRSSASFLLLLYDDREFGIEGPLPQVPSLLKELQVPVRLESSPSRLGAQRDAPLAYSRIITMLPRTFTTLVPEAARLANSDPVTNGCG